MNSYVLQAEPVRHSFEDTLDMVITGAVRIEAAGNKLCAKQDEVVDNHLAPQI